MIRDPGKYAKFDDKTSLTSDKIEDHIARYFEKDNLGTLCNLHMQLCDELGKDWHKDPDTIVLSGLISVAVDFAKHGKCVNNSDFSKIKERVT